MSVRGGSMTAVVRKSIRIPTEGDYLTDGEKLVEVVARCPQGWRVRDVRKSLRGRTELLQNAHVLRWQFVNAEEDTDGD